MIQQDGLVRLTGKRYPLFQRNNPLPCTLLALLPLVGAADSFVIFPEPFLLWESLLHTWNRYSPVAYRFEREGFRTLLLNNIQVTKCSLRTKTLYFPNYTQKGFVGSCSYSIKAPDDDAALLTTLAAFAYYAGVGYKTTMGMGQVRVTFET